MALISKTPLSDECYGPMFPEKNGNICTMCNDAMGISWWSGKQDIIFCKRCLFEEISKMIGESLAEECEFDEKSFEKMIAYVSGIAEYSFKRTCRESNGGGCDINLLRKEIPIMNKGYEDYKKEVL